MKMYSVTKTTLGGREGALATQLLSMHLNKASATKAMREVYDSELQQRNMEDNGASDECGESAPGGYFTCDEAGIYDFADFAFGQLLEVVSLVVHEVKIPQPDLAGVEKGEILPCLILPKGELGTLAPENKIYIVDYQKALNSKGRVYSLTSKDVFVGTILSISYTSQNEFWVEVMAEHILANNGMQQYTCVGEYKLGENAFLNKADADAVL